LSAKNWFKFILLGLIWGSSFLWIKLALQEVGPFFLVLCRTGSALLGLLVVGLITRPKFNKKDLWKFLVLGLFNVAVPFVMISWAEKHISSGMAAILNSTVPLFTILIAPFFLSDEKFSLRNALGLVIGFGGVIILASNQLSKGDSSSGLGILAMLAAACFYAGSGIFARIMTKGMRIETQSIGQMGAAVFFVLPATFIAESPLQLPVLPLTYVSLLWLGLIGSCLSTLIWFSLLHSVGPTRTSMTTYMFPLVGVLLGLIFLGETPDWRILVGGALVILAVVIVNSRAKIESGPKLEPAVEKLENENV